MIMKTDLMPGSSLPLRLAALLALAGTVAFAQTAGRNPESTARRDRAPADSQRNEPPTAGSLFEIEITDGTFVWKGKKVEAVLENVVDLLRERHNGANIVLSPRLPRIRIANLRLRATNLEQELEALRVASGNKFMWSPGNNAPLTDPNTGMPLPTPPPGIDPATGLRAGSQAPLYILTETPGASETRRRVEVFNLSDYFSSLGSGQEEETQKLVNNSLDEIKKIVITTLEAMDQDHNATISFQFHSGANLLVVIGTPDAIEVAERVVAALQAQAGPPAGFPGGAGGAVGGFGMPTPRVYIGPSANSKERRNIMGKLESIRMDSVSFDALPLSEVVRVLVEEIRKRDPEKRGVNFLINPNPPAAPVVPGAAAGIDPVTGLAVPPAQPPAEILDINDITIKINPALTNVRLVDALDAIVRVADHPIKYTVTDYGVVFSLRGLDEPASGVPGPGYRPGYPPMQ